MRDLTRYPDNNPNIIIFDEHGVIYGHKLLRQAIEANQSIQVVTVRGIDCGLLVAYLEAHFPNYACVRALETSDEITPEQLEAISDAIQLTVGDAQYIRELQLLDAARNEESNER